MGGAIVIYGTMAVEAVVVTAIEAHCGRCLAGLESTGAKKALFISSGLVRIRL